MRFHALIRTFILILLATSSLMAPPANAQDETADTFIKRLSADLISSLRTDHAGQGADAASIAALVDAKLMPNVDFARMTASATGAAWRQMTPEQRKRLQDEFKILLIRTYSGALSQVKDVTLNVKPLHAAPQDTEVVVHAEVRGHGDPVQLDYRVEKAPGEGGGWKIYNLNIMGVWLVETYRSQFVQEINARGVDGLINTLTERNKTGAKKG